MSIIINGKNTEATEKPFADYLEKTGYDKRGIAIERNRMVVPKSQYGPIMLQNGDKVELANCAAGG